MSVIQTATLTTSPAPDPTPYLVNTIKLHVLCTNCEAFCRTWKPIKYLIEPNSQPDISWPSIAFLCTFTYLLTSQESCHLCKFLMESYMRNPHQTSKKTIKAALVSDDTSYESLSIFNIYLSGFRHKDGRVVARGICHTELPTNEPDDGSGPGFGGFDLINFHDSATNAFNEHITAASIPRYPRDNLTRVKHWIQTCISDHPICHAFQTSTVGTTSRPTRVIEIMGESHVRLRNNMSSQDFEYLTLSHMWGPDATIQIRLTQSKLTAFESTIPWSELTEIYKEAIYVTRTLGYRYIWIDSLCIIQDSTSDWEFEAQRMAQVYGNAACNLAFLFPPAQSPSPISTRNPYTWNAVKLSSSGIYLRHGVTDLRHIYPEDEDDYPWLDQRSWPLFSRAWTFQEYLLAPRTLLYAAQHLMWQCSATFYDEMLGPMTQASETTTLRPQVGRNWCKTRYFPALMQDIGRELEAGDIGSMNEPRVVSFLRQWFALVHEYCERKLTYATDRMIAFAGIARAYAAVGGLTYLGGAWRECAALSLMWYVQEKPRTVISRRDREAMPGDTGIVKYPTEYSEDGVSGAPSWSWFKVPMYKFYRPDLLWDQDELGVKCTANREPWWTTWHDIYWATQVLYCFPENVENVFPDAGYADFRSLRIVLDTLTWPVSQSLPANLTSVIEHIRSTSPLDDNIGWDPVFDYYPDKIASKRKSPPRNGIFALMAEFQTVRTPGLYHVQRRMFGLVLVPGSDPETWERRGVWKLKIRIGGMKVTKETISDVDERWQGFSMTSSWIREMLVIA